VLPHPNDLGYTGCTDYVISSCVSPRSLFARQLTTHRPVELGAAHAAARFRLPSPSRIIPTRRLPRHLTLLSWWPGCRAHRLSGTCEPSALRPAPPPCLARDGQSSTVSGVDERAAGARRRLLWDSVQASSETVGSPNAEVVTALGLGKLRDPRDLARYGARTPQFPDGEFRPGPRRASAAPRPAHNIRRSGSAPTSRRSYAV